MFGSIQYFQFEQAVIKQNTTTQLHIFRQCRVIHKYSTRRVGFGFLRCQHKFAAFVQQNSAILDLPYPDFRALQVLQDGNLFAQFSRCIPCVDDPLAMLFMGAMRKVHPENINAGFYKADDGIHIRRRWTQR